jgi:hypothetical protein
MPKLNRNVSRLPDAMALLEDARRKRSESIASFEEAKEILTKELERVTRELEDMEMVQSQER